jgi:pyruvate formate lyase activating enzyme
VKLLISAPEDSSLVKGLVFDIQKFSVNDGPGIRTTVFLKGCPLRCLWCHNPESIKAERELSYNAEKCLHCGACVSKCPRRCHSIVPRHVLNRAACIACGICTGPQCPALEIIGREMEAEGVIAEVMKDKVFYEQSGGGMTPSGGEPLLQAEFSLELLRLAKAGGLHTCVETSGCAAPERITALIPRTDIFLFDYKESDPRLHKEYTGVGNDIIFENLKLIDSLGASVILRCPLSPGKNDRDDHFKGIAETAESLNNILEIHIEPYHPLGESKCERIGRDYPLKGLGFPDNDTVSRWIESVSARTKVPVKKA